MNMILPEVIPEVIIVIIGILWILNFIFLYEIFKVS